MIQTIGFCQFTDAFRNADRKDQFSYAALQALFDYLEELEDATGEPYELDVIALCCEFTEYADMKEFQKAYSEDYETIEDIERHTTVIMIDDESFIVEDF